MEKENIIRKDKYGEIARMTDDLMLLVEECEKCKYKEVAASMLPCSSCQLEVGEYYKPITLKAK